ncbi:hypothetical protein LCGC14_2007660 [marine sediment metagenome]|uniref:Uncharacterized protein n=1 Tax=marine sediment metagenome TaxID=412755 RepID=A0A0F9HYB4_9ZZZZ
MRPTAFVVVAPPSVFTTCHGFDVRTIYTGTVTAEVVGFKTFRNESNKHFISHHMRSSHPHITITAITNAECAVALTQSRLPLPARAEIGAIGRNGADANLRPKSRRQAGVTKEGRNGKL